MNGVLMDVQENIGIFLGSLATALGIILGFIFQSGVLNTLVGVAIGAGITYYVQTKTQNRAWKREYSVKIAEVVYGALFKEFKSIVQKLSERYPIYQTSFDTWKEFQQDHRYFMVDESFREKLDLFAEQLDDYSKAAVKLGAEIRNIIYEETERVFGVKTSQIPRPEITYMKKYTHCSNTPDLVQCVASEITPMDFATRGETDVSDEKLTFIMTSLEGHQIHSHDLPIFDKFWQSCLNRMKENNTFKDVISKNLKIIIIVAGLASEITERIEKPWKI